jgi:hypothetical protein
MSINTIGFPFYVPNYIDYENVNYKHWPPTGVAEVGISVFRQKQESFCILKVSTVMSCTTWDVGGSFVYAKKRFVTWMGFIGYYFIYLLLDYCHI